ncbi:MAG: ABC transporter permease [Armatimonadetes bacterium]|nr:ABC transporter permease [Armatimonadota bacterium]
MFLHLLFASFRRSPRRHVLALTALTLGTTVATALGGAAVGVGDQMSRELRAIGANIRILPREDTLPLEINGVDYRGLSEGGFIREADLPAIKENFWRHQIDAFAPLLPAQVALNGTPAVVVGTWFDHPLRLQDGGEARASLPAVQRGWTVEGRWPADGTRELALGRRLAERLRLRIGAAVEVAYRGRRDRLRITGILNAGGPEDDQALAPLPVVQALTGHRGRVKQVLVSAITTPESLIVEKMGLDPTKLSSKDYDRWYCTPYVSAIALHLQESIDGVVAVPVRRATETEGRVLQRISGLMAAAAIAALFAAGLGMFSAAATALLERRREIGLLQALGAERWQIAGLYLGEAFLLGLLGSVLGAILGWGLGDFISHGVFGRPMPLAAGTVLLALGCGLAMALLGAAWPVHRALAVDPVRALREA